MRTIAMRLLALITVTGMCAVASAADTMIREVWTCNIKEGKTMDDVRAANTNWVKFMKANVKGGTIGSNILTNTVGNAEEGRFLYVDTYPSLEVWAVAKSATDGSDEGAAIDAALGEVATCSENRLYESEAS